MSSTKISRCGMIAGFFKSFKLNQDKSNLLDNFDAYLLDIEMNQKVFHITMCFFILPYFCL